MAKSMLAEIRKSGRYARGRIRGKASTRRRADIRAATGGERKIRKRATITAKTATRGRNFAIKLLNMEAHLLPILEDMEKGLQETISEEEKKWIRDKKVVNLIPKIENDLRRLELFTKQAAQLDAEIARVESEEASMVQKNANRVMGYSQEARRLARLLHGKDIQIMELLKYIETELGYIEKALSNLESHKIELKKKEYQEWTQRVRQTLLGVRGQLRLDEMAARSA